MSDSDELDEELDGEEVAELQEMKMEAEGASPVLLVSGAIRGFLARLLRGRMANFYILAYDEIPADKNIRVVTTVGKQSA